VGAMKTETNKHSWW